MSVVQLCSLSDLGFTNNILLLQNFELSKKMRYTEKYDLTHENIHKLKEINEHNAILSHPGRDGMGKKILRLTYSLPPNVTNIDFSRNYIKSIPNNILNKDLEVLNISRNIMTNIDDLQKYLPNLKILKCNDNIITNLPDLPNTLEELEIQNNRIYELPDSIMLCRNMKKLNYEGNPNIQISEEVLDFIQDIFEQMRLKRIEIIRIHQEEQPEEQHIELNRMNRMNRIVEKKINNVKDTIVNDSQNVHELGIRGEVAVAILHLIKDECTISEDEALNEFGKVIGGLDENEDFDYTLYDCLGRKKNNQEVYDINEVGVKEWKSKVSNNPKKDYEFIESLYMRGGHCSESGVTFPVLFKYFWNRIRDNEHRDNILMTFVRDTIPEMRVVCFVGRISRVINCLNGYFEDIVIGISINEQIQMKYNIVSEKFKKYENIPFLYNVLCYYKFKDLLEELEISEQTITKWIYPFIEEIEEITEKISVNSMKGKLPDDIRKRFDEDNQNDIFIT